MHDVTSNPLLLSPNRSSNLLSLDGKFPGGKMCLLLLLLLRHSAGILLRQRTTDRSSLLGSQVEGQVLLLGVEQAQLVALVGIDDGQGAGDGFAEVVSVRKGIIRWLVLCSPSQDHPWCECG